MIKMDSEWHVAKPKRRTKPVQPVNTITVPASTNIKKIPRSIIDQYRPIYVDVTRELSNRFDEINEIFKALAHFQSSKVNHNIHNHNMGFVKYYTKKIPKKISFTYNLIIYLI